MAQGGNITLHILLNNSYHPVLTIPVHDFGHFSIHPLKWLRYLAYTIYGNEGFISTSADGEEIQDYDAPLQHSHYYFHSDDEPLWLDPSAMDDRTTNSTSSSIGRDDFSAQLLTRDKKCIMTDITPTLCEAVHIIPHSKGSKYIAKLHPYHHIDLQPQLDDINDVRNGLLLFNGPHKAFGLSRMAFLRTPNFAMATADVPTIGLDTRPLASRITMQCFDEEVRLLHVQNGLREASHNSDAGLNLQSQDSPTPLLLDFAYGCAALKAWAESDFSKSLKKSTEGIYGNDGDEIDGDEVKQQKQVRRKKVNKKRRDGDLTIQEMLMAFWLFNAKKPRPQEHVETPNSSAVREKVEHWRQAVE